MVVSIKNISKGKEKIEFSYSLPTELLFCLNLLGKKEPRPSVDQNFINTFLTDIPEDLESEVKKWHPFILSLFDSEILSENKLVETETIEEGLEKLKKIPANDYMTVLEEAYRQNRTLISNTRLENYLETPRGLKQDFISFVNAFYKDYFYKQVDTYSLAILKKIREWANALQKQSLPEFFQNLENNLVEYQKDHDILQVHLWLDHAADTLEADRIALMPTIFPYLIFTQDEKEKTIYFYLPILLDKMKATVPVERKSEIGPLVSFFDALSDKTRMKIFLLLNQKEMCNSELAQQLNLSTATISQHLGILKDVNLIKGQREKTNKIYYTPNLEKVKEKTKDFQDLIEAQNPLGQQ